MGLFSSKTRIHVQSMSLKLVADTPNYVQQSVSTSIRLERPIAEDLMANTLRGLGVKSQLFYKYGSKKYHYGLPSGGMVLKHASAETVNLVLNHELSKEVYVRSSVYDSPTAKWFIYDYLKDTRGWNEETDIVSKPPRESVMPTLLANVVFTSSTNVKITYIGDTTYTEEKTVSPVNLSAKYYHVQYSETDSEGVVQDKILWWFYDESTHEYEVLNQINSTVDKYYPVIPLRHNNVDLTVDDDSERYRTSKKLLNKLGLNITELGAGINANPDVGEVDHAYVLLGISPNTPSPSGKAYLFEYFSYLEQNTAYNKTDYLNWRSAQASNTPPLNVVSIGEAGISYKVDIGFLYIDAEIIDGSIGKKGTYTSEIKHNAVIDIGPFDYTDSQLVLRKQINKTQYEQIIVVGPRHVDYVYQGHTITTDLQTITGADYEEDNFLIPLHHDVVNQLGMRLRTELIYEALRIEFHSIVEQKIKWYQTGFFKIVTMVVAVAITIASAGSLSAVLSGAAQLVGASSLVIGALVLASITIGIQYGVAYLVDVLGLELVGILAIAVTIMTSFGGLPYPPYFLTALQSGFVGGFNKGLQAQFQDIADEMLRLQLEMEEAESELERLAEEYDTRPLIDPMLQHESTAGLALPWETPTMYFNTRIHTGNMAPLSYSVVENFVSSNLKLEGVTTHYGI